MKKYITSGIIPANGMNIYIFAKTKGKGFTLKNARYRCGNLVKRHMFICMGVGRPRNGLAGLTIFFMHTGTLIWKYYAGREVFPMYNANLPLRISFKERLARTSINRQVSGTVMKGVNKNVIEISYTEDECFERAILFVRPDRADGDSEHMRKRARDYLSGIKLRPWLYPKGKIVLAAVKLLSAAGAGAAVTALLLLS